MIQPLKHTPFQLPGESTRLQNVSRQAAQALPKFSGLPKYAPDNLPEDLFFRGSTEQSPSQQPPHADAQLYNSSFQPAFAPPAKQSLSNKAMDMLDRYFTTVDYMA